ncbi:MAG TPA: ATP-binding protein [Gemmataceae bacterium]|nr:ATP-binding protein [Gemmataceae bacterium]
MADSGKDARVAFLNRLLDSSNNWTNARAMLADFCLAFGAKAAGFRWPAEGAPSLVAETGQCPKNAATLIVPLDDQPPGALCVDGLRADDELVQLVAKALAASAALRRFLGPIAEQARIAQRLEDVAKVAGRVAHDLDNVFQGVCGFITLAREELEPGSPPHENLGDAETAAAAGLRFCDQLHQLSRGGHARPVPSSVQVALTREAARLAKNHSTVRVQVDAPSELPAAAIEGAPLQMILGHLLDNAAEASPKDGQVKVTARLVELAPGDLGEFLGRVSAGPHIEVRVADAGPGLTDEARRRMFVEPFFTTKYRHRGLSLAVVYRMLYAHRGGVQADARPGPGTTMRVVFPLAAARVPAVESGRSCGGSLS